MDDLKKLALESIEMLEKYYDAVRKMPNTPKTMGISKEDTKLWKNVYYPQLVESGHIRDGEFFEKPLKNRNYGIGADAIFTKYEYVQYLWSAYKFIVNTGDFKITPAATYIKQCIDMLEPYAGNFQNHSTETELIIPLKSEDMNKWKNEYYSYFSKSCLIPDGYFFGDVNKDKRYGIGNDGYFSGEELCHFLYQLYRLAYENIRKYAQTA